MQRLIKNLSSLSLLFFLVGCSVPNLEKKDTNSNICYSTPKWVINIPVSKTKIYGVGIAGENMNGFNAQRRSAISKAINEIAMQMKVKVNNSFYSRQNSTGYKYSDNITFQTVDNQTVSAKIVKSCKNPNNGMFYVLMEANKR